MTKISLEYGHAPESCMAYATTTDYQTGYEFGELLLKLSDKINCLVQQCCCYNSIINSIYGWTHPIYQVNASLREAVYSSQVAGTSLSASSTISHQLTKYILLTKDNLIN